MQITVLLALGCACVFAAVMAVWVLSSANKGSAAAGGTTAPPINTGGGSSTGTASLGRVLGTVQQGTLPITIRAGNGTGSGNHALNKKYGGAPFPVGGDGGILSFEIQFAPGFEWGCRGKIGGLHVGTGKASGGNFSDNGASARAMWDANGGSYCYVYIPAGTAGQQPEEVRPERDGVGGIVFQPDFRRIFQAGKWHRIDIGVKLNAVGKNDGRLLYAVDGKTRTVNNVIWRKSNLPIEYFSVGVFHGGGCSATRTSNMAIRNVRMYEWKE